MVQGANSTGKAVAKTKVANIKSKNARASLANITMLFPPDTSWRRGWSYVQREYGTHFYVMYATPAEPCFFLTKRGFLNDLERCAPE